MLGRGVSHASQPAASASIPPIIGPVAGARRWPVGAVLVLLVSALVLPGLVFSATLLGRLAASERAGLAAEAQAVTVRTAEALDRELTAQQATLRALASSPALAEGNLATFYNQARDVVDAADCNVVLSDLAGQMLLNTCLPFGAPLPRVGQPDLYARAAKERSLVVSNLFTGVVHGEPIQPIVKRSGGRAAGRRRSVSTGVGSTTGRFPRASAKGASSGEATTTNDVPGRRSSS